MEWQAEVHVNLMRRLLTSLPVAEADPLSFAFAVAKIATDLAEVDSAHIYLLLLIMPTGGAAYARLN